MGRKGVGLGGLIDAENLGIGKANPEAFIKPDYAYGWNAAIEAIKTAPTIDAVPVVHGRWIHDSIGFSDFWICSACRETWFFEDDPQNESTRVNYCPNCGAKMDGEADV